VQNVRGQGAAHVRLVRRQRAARADPALTPGAAGGRAGVMALAARLELTKRCKSALGSLKQALTASQFLCNLSFNRTSRPNSTCATRPSCSYCGRRYTLAPKLPLLK
jgi:hypothetical protein